MRIYGSLDNESKCNIQKAGTTQNTIAVLCTKQFSGLTLTVSTCIIQATCSDNMESSDWKQKKKGLMFSLKVYIYVILVQFR